MDHENEEWKERLQPRGGIEIPNEAYSVWANSDQLARELQMRIQDGGDESATTRAIRRGILKQLEKRNWKEDDSCWIAYLDCDGSYRDELSGELLESEGVKEARREEIKELYKHEVYTKVPEEECWKYTGKEPISVKWVDVNKGDKVHPEYRSRLVAKEIKADKRIDLFAATPPLEGKKLLLAMAVTEGIGYERGNKEGGIKLDFIDIRRAFFQTLAKRNVCEATGRGL